MPSDCGGVVLLTLNKALTAIFLIFLIITLTGCTAIGEKYQGAKAKIKDKFTKNESILPKIIRNGTCDAVPCDCGEDLDALLYYFDTDMYQGLTSFIEASDEFLDCAMIRLDTDEFTPLLLDRNTDLPMRILFDKTSTMDCDDTACLPYAVSQYNGLYSKGLNLRTVDDLHQTFCLNEEGLFITSALLDDEHRKDFAMFIKSPGLAQVYQDRFDQIWGEGS